MEEYEPIKVLGEGSFGKVYLMKHEKTKELVCTKVIRLKNIPAKEQVACRNEVEMLRRMCHPNIVGYTNSLIYKNCLCIIMEYCDAGDLGDRVKEAKDILFAESKIMTWFVQITLGLHYMHTNRILHRDIKTQNVFILSSGRLVLGDLGISKLLASTRDFTSTCIGTPYYMSPEIFKNNPYNDKSDVWALGCLLYELLTLKHAFDAQSLNGLVGKIIKGKFPPISTQYSKSLRALVNDMLSTNPKKRPDTEQILRKPFVQMKVKQFVADLNSETLHREEEAMDNLSDQLLDLRMADAVPEKNLLVDTRLDDEGGPNAPSPSESDTAAAAAAAAAAVASASTRSGPRFQLRVQKHQLELEEEKRMAAEMALKRLKKKTAERQRRATLSLSESPIAGGSTGVGKTLNAETPRSPGSPNGGGDDADSPPGRGRKLSLLQRLSYITTSSSLSRKKAMSTPTSPSETVDSSLSPSHSNREKRRPKGTARKNDVNRAVALTLAEAEATETVKQMDAGPERNGVLAAKAATPPNSLPQRSLAGPKEATESVSATTPRRRSMSGSDAIDNIASYKPPSDILAGKDKTNGGSGGSGSSRKNMRRPQRGKLPRLNIDSGSSSPTADVLYSGPRSARSEDSTEGTSQHTTSESLKPEEDADLFQTLKKQAKAHAREGEDKEIHDREEELRVRLREAERRCRDLQVNMQRVQETAGSLSGPAVVASIPPPVPVMVASRPLDPMQPPAIQNETHGVGAGSDDCSLTGPCVVDDRYFDVNWETVPYCESHMEEIHDPPSPVDELADRVKVLTKKCIEGLGQKNFEMALELLKRMQEGDCKVIVEGVVYDGNDEGDVEKALERVIGKLKLHYWHLLDQLLLMT